MKKMKIDSQEGEAIVLWNKNSDTYFIGSEEDIRAHILKVGSLKKYSEELCKRIIKGSSDHELKNGEMKFYPA